MYPPSSVQVQALHGVSLHVFDYLWDGLPPWLSLRDFENDTLNCDVYTGHFHIFYEASDSSFERLSTPCSCSAWSVTANFRFYRGLAILFRLIEAGVRYRYRSSLGCILISLFKACSTPDFTHSPSRWGIDRHQDPRNPTIFLNPSWIVDALCVDRGIYHS